MFINKMLQTSVVEEEKLAEELVINKSKKYKTR